MFELSPYRKTLIIGLLCTLNALYFLSTGHRDLNQVLKNVLFDFGLPKVVCFSPAEIATPIGQLLYSSLIIIGICALCQYTRKTISTYVSDPLVQVLLKEAVAAADLCGCCFELIIVADNFGVWMYGFYLFLLTIWWSRAWEQASACPYTHLEEVVMGQQESQTALMKTWAELTGGILMYRLIQFIWSLELVETHENRAVQQCTADLQVTITVGSFIEGFATCLCQLIGKAINDLQPKHGDIIGSFLGTALVVAAFDYTGGYFNPVLATALKFGCKGNTFTEHVVVYWFGACLGSILSIFLYHHTSLKSIVCNFARTKENEEEEYEKEE